MKVQRYKYLKNKFLPLFLFSLIAGIFTGAVIFLFKLASSYVISISGQIYAFVRSEVIYIPLLVIGAGIVGFLASLILRFVPDCRGGGMPSSIAALRDQVPIMHLVSLPFVFVSSLLTYICGVPLGTEGPSVQMGTMVGWLTSRVLSQKNRVLRRYVMTGGACAGFAAATGAPLTGMLFAFEEVHLKFTPMIFMSASLTVAASSVVTEILCSLAGISSKMFDFSINFVMDIKYVWIAVIIGLVCGVFAMFFTNIYRKISRFLGKRINKLPFSLRISMIFVIVSLIGVVFAECIGTGHHLTEELLKGHGVWYLIIIFLLVRTLLLVVANSQGVTGGLFIPTLAFGAMIGALCGKGMVAVGFLPQEYYIVTVVIGMTAFLAASSRIPLIALAFSLEALAGLSNFLPISIGVAVAYATIEFIGVVSFHDAIVERKIENFNKGREIFETEVELIVKPDSFVIGQEVRDVFWPADCVVVSVIKNPDLPHHTSLAEGDLLQVHYKTTHPRYTEDRLEELVGKQ